MQDAQRTEQRLLHPRPALSAATDLQGSMTADGHAVPAQGAAPIRAGAPARPRPAAGRRIGRPAHRPRIPCSARSGADATGRDAPAGWPSSPADRCRNNTPGCPASGSARGHRATGQPQRQRKDQGPGPRQPGKGATPKAGAGSRPAGPSASCARARHAPPLRGRHPPPGHPRRPDSTDDCTRHCPPAAARPRTARA